MGAFRASKTLDTGWLASLVWVGDTVDRSDDAVAIVEYVSVPLLCAGWALAVSARAPLGSSASKRWINGTPELLSHSAIAPILNWPS